jgi:hypothetical protein
MFAVSDYHIETYTLSNGVDVHVLLRPDEDAWVPVFQICRGSDSFKRHKRNAVGYSESDMLQRVSDCNKNVIGDPDRTYSVWLKKANVISFAGMAERAEHCDQPGYLAFWARFLYEVILPKYPGYVTVHAAEVQGWQAATMPLVFPAPPDAESVLVLMTPDHGGVVCYYRAGSRIAWGVRVKVPLSDGAEVARFLPTDSSRVVALLDWLANYQGEELRLVPARVEDGRIMLEDGTLIAGTPKVDESAGEETREVGEDHLPVVLPFHEDEIHVIYDQRTGKDWTVLRRICENLGIDPDSQRRRLARTRWATTVIMTVVAADGSIREQLCVDRRTLLMWLATIEPGRIGVSEVARKVELYQDEVADLLEAHFGGKGGMHLTPAALRDIIRTEIEATLGDRFTRLTMDVDGWQNLALETTRAVSELIDQVNTLGTTVDQVLDKVSARRPRFWRVKTGLRIFYKLSGKGLHDALAAIKDKDLRKKLYTANPDQVNNKLGRFCAELVKQDEQDYQRRLAAGDDKARRRFLRQTRVIGGHEYNVYNKAVIRHLGDLIRSGGEAPPVIPIKEI